MSMQKLKENHENWINHFLLNHFQYKCPVNSTEKVRGNIIPQTQGQVLPSGEHIIKPPFTSNKASSKN